jgi:ubiquinone/menaquinone biosynthesis C-methylase UbiE
MSYTEARNAYFTKKLRRERTAKALNLIAQQNPRYLLDIGCGPGFNLFAMSKKVDVAVGVDIADNNCLWKQYKRETKTSNTEFLRCDVRRLPFRDRSFDIVNASQVLEHIPDVNTAISEIRRVAKTSIIVDVPTLLWEVYYYLFGIWWWALTHPKHVISKFIRKTTTTSAKAAAKDMCVGNHVNKLNARQWIELLRNNGLYVEECKKICSGKVLFIHATRTE